MAEESDQTGQPKETRAERRRRELAKSVGDGLNKIIQEDPDIFDMILEMLPPDKQARLIIPAEREKLLRMWAAQEVKMHPDED